jgi:voltage-gated sodium channel
VESAAPCVPTPVDRGAALDCVGGFVSQQTEQPGEQLTPIIVAKRCAVSTRGVHESSGVRVVHNGQRSETAGHSSKAAAVRGIPGLTRIVNSDRFQFFIVAIIIANAVVLGLSTYREIDVQYSELLAALSTVFYAIFLLELLLRIASYFPRPWEFFRSGWNIFDFIVIGAVLLPVVREQSTILRILRLARVARLMRFLPDAGVLIRTVTRATPAAASMVALTLMLLFIYGIIGWSLFGDALPDEWGDIGTAMLTLFIVLTLEGFPDYLSAAQAVSPWATVFFLSYILIAAFVVINLLIGIVLDAMERAREEQAREARKSDSLHMADLLDRLDDMRGTLNELESELEFYRRSVQGSSGSRPTTFSTKPQRKRTLGASRSPGKRYAR